MAVKVLFVSEFKVSFKLSFGPSFSFLILFWSGARCTMILRSPKGNERDWMLVHRTKMAASLVNFGPLRIFHFLSLFIS